MQYLTAKEVMNPNVISVPAEWTIEELSQFLIDRAITGAPVKNENGNLIGVVSLTDIVRHNSLSGSEIKTNEPHDYYQHGWEDRVASEEWASFRVTEKPQTLVRDIMTSMIFKVDENTSLKEVADTMIDGRVHRLFVTRGGQVIGIVTTMDMLKAIRDK